jgi:hypothetical protein
MQLDLNLTVQRHNQGRIFYRPTREYFDPRQHHVDQIPNDTTAKNFILAHHYSQSFPAAIASFGLFETSATSPACLVGVATFSVPMGTSKTFIKLLEADEQICELGRFVLLDHVGSNAETWFLAKARSRLARAKRTSPTASMASKPVHPLIISYSDPVPRSNARGDICFRGHFGKIYQGEKDGGANTGMGLYTGRGAAKTMWLTQDGSCFVDRILNKLKNGETGEQYVQALLLKHGAPRRDALEPGSHYVTRALREGPFRLVRHRGNHRYIFTAGCHKRQKQLRQQIDPQLPYPRFTDPV